MIVELCLMFILSFANDVLNNKNELDSIKNIFIGKHIALIENQPIYMEYSNGATINTSLLPNPENRTRLARLIPDKKSNNSLLDNIVGSENDYLVKGARSKRNVFDLYNMIDCATGCNPLIYKGYGCYCGFLGSGYAVDGIDRCCKQHDWCYNSTNCPLFFEYFVPYHWKCYNNRGFCAFNHPQWNYLDPCARSLGECDRLLTECLRQFPCPTSKAICPTSSWRFFKIF